MLKWKAGVSIRRWLFHLSPELSRSPSPSRDRHGEWAKEDLPLDPHSHPQSPSLTVTHQARVLECHRTACPWVQWQLKWVKTIRGQVDAEERDFWWGVEASSQESAFPFQPQHSRMGPRAQEAGRGEGTRSGRSTEQSKGRAHRHTHSA